MQHFIYNLAEMRTMFQNPWPRSSNQGLLDPTFKHISNYPPSIRILLRRLPFSKSNQVTLIALQNGLGAGVHTSSGLSLACGTFWKI